MALFKVTFAKIFIEGGTGNECSENGWKASSIHVVNNGGYGKPQGQKRHARRGQGKDRNLPGCRISGEKADTRGTISYEK